MLGRLLSTSLQVLSTSLQVLGTRQYQAVITTYKVNRVTMTVASINACLSSLRDAPCSVSYKLSWIVRDGLGVLRSSLQTHQTRYSPITSLWTVEHKALGTIASNKEQEMVMSIDTIVLGLIYMDTRSKRLLNASVSSWVTKCMDMKGHSHKAVEPDCRDTGWCHSGHCCYCCWC